VSQYYELGDVTLWNPSNGASRLFLGQVALFEEEVGLPSGIGPMEHDEAQVSAEAFEVSIDVIFACASGLRRMAMCSIPGSLMSSM